MAARDLTLLDWIALQMIRGGAKRPSLKEIGFALGGRSTTAAFTVVKRLKSAGLVKRKRKAPKKISDPQAVIRRAHKREMTARLSAHHHAP